MHAAPSRRRYTATLPNEEATTTTVNNIITMTTTSAAWLTSHSLTTINIATVAMATTTVAWPSLRSSREWWTVGRRMTTSRERFVGVARRSRRTNCTSSSERSTRRSTPMCLRARNWHSGLISARREFRLHSYTEYHCILSYFICIIQHSRCKTK